MVPLYSPAPHKERVSFKRQISHPYTLLHFNIAKTPRKIPVPHLYTAYRHFLSTAEALYIPPSVSRRGLSNTN